MEYIEVDNRSFEISSSQIRLDFLGVKMEANNFLVGDFFIVVALSIEFPLYGKNDEISWSFFSTCMF